MDKELSFKFTKEEGEKFRKKLKKLKIKRNINTCFTILAIGITVFLGTYMFMLIGKKLGIEFICGQLCILFLVLTGRMFTKSHLEYLNYNAKELVEFLSEIRPEDKSLKEIKKIVNESEEN